MNIHVTVEGPFDYVPRLLGQGDITLTDWSSCLIITWGLGFEACPGLFHLAADLVGVA